MPKDVTVMPQLGGPSVRPAVRPVRPLGVHPRMRMVARQLERLVGQGLAPESEVSVQATIDLLLKTPVASAAPPPSDKEKALLVEKQAHARAGGLVDRKCPTCGSSLR